MLNYLDSRELGQWMAYEKYAGPVGNDWRDDMLATIAELIQVQNRLQGGHFEDNPAPEPQSLPRPWEMDSYRKKHPSGPEGEPEWLR